MAGEGGPVDLRPAGQADRRRFYDWLRGFDGTPAHDGLPDFEMFSGAEEDFFFDGTAPHKGRYFVIVDHSGRDVGCISYTCFHLRPGMAEFDLWLAGESLCGRGYGTAAIRALLETVRRDLGVHTVLIRPSKRNARAIRAYAKSGFGPMPGQIADYMLPEYLASYGDGDFGIEETYNLTRFLV
ncbi:MAG: GNAT family N-acetyltransferase [Thermodesulfobacteriota bacterium]